MKTFSQFLALTEDRVEQPFPPTIYLRRQAVRQYPSATVALYKDQYSKLTIAIPSEWVRRN